MSTNNDLRADQASKLTLISDLKSKLENEKMLTRSREESERLMLLEIKLRKNVESELEKTKILLRDERLAFFKFKQYLIS